jgi:hypothetical protein
MNVRMIEVVFLEVPAVKGETVFISVILGLLFFLSCIQMFFFHSVHVRLFWKINKKCLRKQVVMKVIRM